MKSTRSIRSILSISTAMGLVLVVAGCAGSSRYAADAAPKVNMEDQDERADMLLRHCRKLQKGGDFYAAASMCQRAFDTRPTDPAPLYPLAEIYKHLGSVQQAADAYRAALLINPEDFEALYGLAKTSIDLGKYDIAEAQLERALQLNDSDPRVYNAMGIVKDQKGQHDVAQALYRTGLLIDPDNVPLRNNLGLSLALTGDQAESVAMLREIVSEPRAGSVGGQNLALAATYNAPSEVMAAKDTADGPIEIRTAGLEDEDGAEAEFAEGDETAAAMSKPLRKQGVKVASTGPKTRSIGSAGGRAQPDSGGGITARVAPKSPQYEKDPPKSSGPKIAKKPAAGAKGYQVQVGAFGSQKRAERAWKAVMASSKDLVGELSYEVVMADLGQDKGIVYRLRAGPLTDRAASDRLCSDLKGRGHGCFVVQLPKSAAKPAAKAAAKPAAKPTAETKAMPAATKKPQPLTSGSKADQPIPKKTKG